MYTDEWVFWNTGVTEMKDFIHLRGFDPLLKFFIDEIKIVSHSLLVVEYNSNGKL